MINIAMPLPAGAAGSPLVISARSASAQPPALGSRGLQRQRPKAALFTFVLEPARSSGRPSEGGQAPWLI